MQEEADSGSLQDLLENALDPILVILGNVPVLANAPALALTGYDRDEILGLSLDDLIHPDQHDHIPALQHPREPGSPASGSFHTVLVCQDRSLRPVEVSTLQTTWNGGPAAILVLRDTSKRADEIAHLREIEQNLRFLIENTVDGILVGSPEGRHLYANRSACEITGYTADELLQMGYVDLIHPQEIPKVRERYDARVSGRPAPKRYETLAVRKDGSTIAIELTAATTTWRGRLADVVIVRDITPRKQDQARLAEAREVNERLRREVDDRHRIEAALRRRDAILEAVSFAAERLLAAERLEDGIDAVLERLGTAAEAERASLYVLHSDEEGLPRTSRRFSWGRPGAALQEDDAVFRNIPLSIFPVDWVQTLRRGVPVRFSAGETPEILGKLLQKMHTSSILALAVRIEENLWGFLALSNPGTEPEWQAPEIEALRLAGNVLGAVIQRQAVDLSIRRRDAVLEAVSYAAERLLTAAEWHRDIPELLKRLAIAAGADQASLYEAERDRDGVLRSSRRFVWTAPGTPRAEEPPQFQRVPISGFFSPKEVRALCAGESVVLHPDAPTLARGGAWEPWATVLTLPIHVGGELWGGLGLDSLSATISWQRPVRDALQAAANLVGAAVQRVAVADSLRRKDQILEAVSFTAERLLSLPRWQEEVEQVLERLGKAADVDRVVIQEIRAQPDGEERLYWEHAWASEKFPSLTPGGPAEGIPIIASGYAAVLQALRQGQAQVIPAPDAPPEVREVVHRFGVLSILTLPVQVHGRLWGVIGFCECRGERTWSTPEVDALRTSGEILGVAMERQEGDEALRRSEGRYRSLVEGTDQVVAVIDRNGIFRFANARALTYLGMGSLIGRAMWEVFPQAIADRQMDSIRKSLDRGEVQVIQDVTSIRGDLRWFESRLQPMPDHSGRFDAVQLIGTDITERKRAEVRILSYQARLRSLTSELALTEQRERRRIAGELHDRIGQFLAVTKIKLAQLREEAASSELRKPLDEIWGLIDQSIQDTRSLTFELSPPILYELGLEPALEWLVETMSTRHGLSATFHDDGSSKPLGQDLRGLLFQAARELMLNVAKHATAKTVEVAVRREGDEICCEVADDGCGFDPTRVFTATLGGANPRGFGLFSIRERLEQLGGRLELDTAVGRGTRAVLHAPLRPQTQSSDGAGGKGETTG
jgi:PAS domain S-box-containing protein